MVDIPLPVCCFDPVLRHVAFGKFENDGFRVVYPDDGMKMMRHVSSCLPSIVRFEVGTQIKWMSLGAIYLFGCLSR
jgi:hypothetical protein